MSPSSTFVQYSEKATEWVREAMKELSIPEEKAIRVIRVVLHTLRDQIPIEESLHLISQLPMIWKGIYVDGWKLRMSPVRMNGWNDYLEKVRAYDKKMAGYDFGNDQHAKYSILCVWRIIANHVTEGEITHICSTLSDEIKTSIHDKIKIPAT